MSILKWLKGLKKSKKIDPGYLNTVGSGTAQRYMYTWNQIDGTSSATDVVLGSNLPTDPNASKAGSRSDQRLEVKPKDIVTELFDQTEVSLDFTNLAAKIKAVNKRYRFMVDDLQLPAAEEKQALEWLRARERYAKLRKGFEWQITTDKKIGVLCSKYKVRQVGIKGYHRCVPQEAVDQITKYLAIYRKVTRGKEPTIDLIVDDGGPETKKDPIVLASSPFGKFWYICGAWGPERDFVDELFLL